MSKSLAAWSSRVALLVGGLIFAEVALQAVSVLSPAAGARLSGLKPRYVVDPVLDVRGDPAWTEYDEAGFRNAERPRRATIVAIGDSQTEGSGVARENAWPQQVARMTNTDVYQMAFGSYGPGHYLSLIDDALALEPKTVVVAIYTGNDLAGVYEWVYDKGRNSELRSTDPQVLAALAAADRERGPEIDAGWRETRDAEKGLTGRPISRWLRTNVLESSKVVALYEQLEWRSSGGGSTLDTDAGANSWDNIEQITHAVSPNLLFPYVDGAVRAVFTPRARLSALDLDDPRIAEALRVTLAMLDRIASAAAGRARLVVLLVPTKETVFARRVAAHAPSVPADFSKLVEAEEQVRSRIIEFLQNERGIQWIDPLQEMRSTLEADGPLTAASALYPASWDGHPAAPGQVAIARATVRRGIGGGADPRASREENSSAAASVRP